MTCQAAHVIKSCNLNVILTLTVAKVVIKCKGFVYMSKFKEAASPQHQESTDTITELQPPPMYKVVLNNDDYTPMDFVVEILQKFFRMNLEQATEVMLAVHYQGKGVCGIYTAEIAETKVAQVNEYAREYQHPLLCSMEQA